MKHLRAFSSHFGRRGVVFSAVLIGLMVLSGCFNLNLSPRFVSPGSTSPPQTDSTRIAVRTDQPLQLPLTQIWDYNARAGFGTSALTIVDSTVFIAARDGRIHAVDLATGDRLGMQDFAGAVEGQVLVRGNMLYVPTVFDPAGVTAYNLATGKVTWRINTAAVESGLAWDDDYVFFGDTDGVLHAVNAANGQLEWTDSTAASSSYLASPVAVDGRIVIGDTDGHVRVYSASDGTIEWSARVGGPVYSPPMATNTHVFITTTHGTVHRLNLTDGTKVWRFQSPEGITRLTTAVQAGGHLVVGGADGLVRALDPASGALRWITTVGGPVLGAPVWTGDHIVLGSMDRTVSVLNPLTGVVDWQTTVEGKIRSSPAVSRGYLVVASRPHNVYGFTAAFEQPL